VRREERGREGGMGGEGDARRLHDEGGEVRWWERRKGEEGERASRSCKDASRPAAARAGLYAACKILRPDDTPAGRCSGLGRPAQSRQAKIIRWPV
jgi:hypothetical protein